MNKKNFAICTILFAITYFWTQASLNTEINSLSANSSYTSIRLIFVSMTINGLGILIGCFLFTIFLKYFRKQLVHILIIITIIALFIIFYMSFETNSELIVICGFILSIFGAGYCIPFSLYVISVNIEKKHCGKSISIGLSIALLLIFFVSLLPSFDFAIYFVAAIAGLFIFMIYEMSSDMPTEDSVPIAQLPKKFMFAFFIMSFFMSYIFSYTTALQTYAFTRGYASLGITGLLSIVCLIPFGFIADKSHRLLTLASLIALLISVITMLILTNAGKITLAVSISGFFMSPFLIYRYLIFTDLLTNKNISIFYSATFFSLSGLFSVFTPMYLLNLSRNPIIASFFIIIAFAVAMFLFIIVDFIMNKNKASS